MNTFNNSTIIAKGFRVLKRHELSQFDGTVGNCPWCKKRTMKLIGYEVDGAGIPIDLTKSYECVYKPCEEYKSDAMTWRWAY